VAYTVGSTRQKLSMIATVTNRGKARWMIIDEAFNSDRLIEFLEALIKDAGKKVFLILDNLRVHHSKPVKAWLAERTKQIEVFYLAQLQPGAQSGRAAQCRPQASYGQACSGQNKGQTARCGQRAHDHAGEITRAGDELLSGSVRQVCSLKLHRAGSIRPLGLVHLKGQSAH
jgi:hypothetical protein